jgi:Flp pilus assembly protein TadD
VATVTGDRKPRITDGKTVQNNAAPLTKPKRARVALKRGTKTKLPRKKIRLKSVEKIRVASRTKELVPQGRKTIRNTKVVNRTRNEITNNTTVVPDSTQPLRIDRQGRRGRRDRQTRWDTNTRYRDRHHRTRRVHRHEHVYRDRHDRLCHRIVWPRYRFPVCYNWGSRFTFRYVYPYHHRRYVFVSLGGYWPAHYRYSRYYWYGCHPYYWYGYYPVAREVVGDTYNYYTYNYSYGESYAPAASYQSEEDVGVVDHTTFADVRERLAQQAADPNAPTPADTYFEEAVKAFEEGEYNMAAEKFAEAMELAPEDMVLPFAYAQALFANGQYSDAADALRSALEKVSPEAEGVFYPRGLYTEDEVLLEQIDLLTKAAELYTSDADLQLLLGYHLLGIGEVDEALEPLQQAGLDLENKDSAEVLLNLLEKIKTEKPENADQ